MAVPFLSQGKYRTLVLDYYSTILSEEVQRILLYSEYLVTSVYTTAMS